MLYIQKRLAGQGEGVQLAARAQRHDLSGNAPVLAEGDAALDLAGRRGNVAAAGYRAGELIFVAWVSQHERLSIRQRRG
jgi:hypothetical protein